MARWPRCVLLARVREGLGRAHALVRVLAPADYARLAGWLRERHGRVRQSLARSADGDEPRQPILLLRRRVPRHRHRRAARPRAGRHHRHLAGIYYGAQYGGSTTAILVNLPGESSSVVTAMDGYQMARQGK